MASEPRARSTRPGGHCAFAVMESRFSTRHLGVELHARFRRQLARGPSLLLEVSEHVNCQRRSGNPVR
jgi:hypothetical protein